MHLIHNFLIYTISSCNNTTKAMLYDIAVKTGFIFKPSGFFTLHCYELLDVVWFDWKKDLLEISKNYPNDVISVIFPEHFGYTTFYIRNGKSYSMKTPFNGDEPVFDESRLVEG